METDGFLQYCTLLPPEKTITTYYFSMLEEELNIEDDRVSIVICVFFLSRSSKAVLLLSAHCYYPFRFQYNTVFPVAFSSTLYLQHLC